MVSNRCKLAVKIKKLGLHFIVVDLGEVDVMENITSTQREQLKAGCLVPVLSLWMIKSMLIEKLKM
jgi:hypothetical protein